MPRVAPADLEQWAASVLGRLDVPPDLATTVAAHLVDGDVSGHQTHGVVLLPEYVAALKEGRISLCAHPSVADSGSCWIQVDGHHGFGAVVLGRTVELAEPRARAEGLCLAAVANCGHTGRLGAFVERCAFDGFVSLLLAGTCNDPDDAVAAAPYALDRQLGTNPLAVGIPAGQSPFVFDAATTQISYYELTRAARARERVPAESLRDARGAPATDPAAFYAGGSLTTIGGHKGFGLAAAIALLCGLSGEYNEEIGLFGGYLMLVIDPVRAAGEAYGRAVVRALEVMRETRTTDGRPLRLAGDGLKASRALARHHGVQITSEVWEDLASLGTATGVALPQVQG